MDVSHEQEVMEMLLNERPDVVVHSAAYTNVDKAELEKESAYQVNALGALHIAKACEIIGAKLVYVSTDYVFDGTKGAPYDENDAPNPLNVYGHSKLSWGEIRQHDLFEAFYRTNLLVIWHERNKFCNQSIGKGASESYTFHCR